MRRNRNRSARANAVPDIHPSLDPTLDPAINNTAIPLEAVTPLPPIAESGELSNFARTRIMVLNHLNRTPVAVEEEGERARVPKCKFTFSLVQIFYHANAN